MPTILLDLPYSPGKPLEGQDIKATTIEVGAVTIGGTEEELH